MGIVRMGPPEELLLRLREKGFRTFVETGTFRGDTALWASTRFDRVRTGELSEALVRAARDRLAPCRNVEVLHGHSVEALTKLVPTLTEPAVFWLDSHWCGGSSSDGENEECPLLGELNVLGRSSCRMRFWSMTHAFSSRRHLSPTSEATGRICRPCRGRWRRPW